MSSQAGCAWQKTERNAPTFMRAEKEKHIRSMQKKKKIALKTAEALGAYICGVDMLRGSKGPVVIEANVSPGLQGITAATKIDVADKIAKFLHDQTTAFLAEKNNSAAHKIMQEHVLPNNEIITNLTFKGDRILLPEIVTKLTG